VKTSLLVRLDAGSVGTRRNVATGARAIRSEYIARVLAQHRDRISDAAGRRHCRTNLQKNAIAAGPVGSAVDKFARRCVELRHPARFLLPELRFAGASKC
jgi:hypothetical protein